MTVEYYEPEGYIDSSQPRCDSVVPNIATEPVSIIRCPSQKEIQTIVVELDTKEMATVEFCQSCRENYRRNRDGKLGVTKEVLV